MADKSKGLGVPTNSTPKKRKVRFSDHEIRILVDEIMANAEKLFGKKACNALGKAAIWEQAVRKVNTESDMKRTEAECKKRWHDYKRKIVLVLKKSVESGSNNIVSMENLLSTRQLRVAKFFQMDPKRQNEIQALCDEISFDGDMSTPSTHENSLFIDLSGADSEEDFIPVTQKRMKSSRLSGSDDDAQDKSISQSNAQTPSVESDSKDQKPAELTTSAEDTLTVQNKQIENLDGKLEELITFQKKNSDLLQNIQASLSTTQQLQKKMNRLLKINFIQLQKSMNQSQKSSKENENIMDLRLKGIMTALEDLKDSLREKMQDSISSDDSNDEHSVGQPGSTRSIKTSTSSPGKRKRKLN